jgi:hypothetical protein
VDRTFSPIPFLYNRILQHDDCPKKAVISKRSEYWSWRQSRWPYWPLHCVAVAGDFEPGDAIHSHTLQPNLSLSLSS